MTLSRDVDATGQQSEHESASKRTSKRESKQENEPKGLRERLGVEGLDVSEGLGCEVEDGDGAGLLQTNIHGLAVG